MAGIRWAVTCAVAGFCSMGLLTVGGVGFYRQYERAAMVAAAVGAAPTPAPVARISLAEPARVVDPQAGYYTQLRERLRWVDTRLAGQEVRTPDHESRMMLAKSAAERAGLSQVGLSFMDVYGIINAETSWAPRAGRSKDGTPNLGIAQFEPATARALGLRDPEDVVEAVHVAAVHMKEAADWSRDRLARLKLGPAERAAKLREGVSIYYNLSTRGRNQWNGLNTAQLPRETQRHILNARLGAQEAALMEAQLRAGEFAGRGAVVTASKGGNAT